MDNSDSSPTQNSSPEETIDLRLARPHASAQLSASAEHGEEPCGCVALVTGSKAPELSSEVYNLLRRRLRIAALIMFGGFTIFLIRHAFAVEASSPVSIALFAAHAAVAITLGFLGVKLCQRCTIGLRWLRVAELMIFGLPAVFLLAAQSYMALHHAERGHFLFEGGPWVALIYTYALFIPNTLRRAGIVIAAMAITPMILLSSLLWASPELRAASTVEQLTGFPLMLIVCSLGSVFGVDTIGTLRREAFEARRLGQYVLKKRIGAGGMGEVYLAEHQLLKRPCVIKLIQPEKAGDPRVLARFEREVRASARLTHWNTIEIFDYGSTGDGTFYYVMEHLPGMSLADLVARHGPLPPERVIYLARQACDALGEAHGMGLVHRDLKPGNIFAAQRGGVYDVTKLLDFGLVKPLAGTPDSDDLDLTTEGSITGSPLYMSPEQVTGEMEPDARSDIYSLGAVMYFLLTGRPPFDGDKPMRVMISHVHDEVIPPSRHRPEIPADVEKIVLRCLSKSPAKRFQDAASLEEALARCELADAWTRHHADAWWRAVCQTAPAG